MMSTFTVTITILDLLPSTAQEVQALIDDETCPCDVGIYGVCTAVAADGTPLDCTRSGCNYTAMWTRVWFALMRQPFEFVIEDPDYVDHAWARLAHSWHMADMAARATEAQAKEAERKDPS